MKIKNTLADGEDLPELTALIDIIFLLVVYFMGTSTLEAEEADMGIMLPAMVPTEEALTFPLEVMVDILPNGQVLVNEGGVDTPGSREMPQFITQLISLRRSTEVSGTPMFVFIRPAPEAAHQRSLDVLNALAKAKVKQVSFAMNEEDY